MPALSRQSRRHPREAGQHLRRLARGLALFGERPRSEPSLPGLLTVEADDRLQLWGGARSWGRTLRAYLRGRGWASTVVIAFDPATGAALSTSRAGLLVTSTERAEREDARGAPLTSAGLSEGNTRVLKRAGARTVGDFLALSARWVGQHLGDEGATLHALLRGERQLGIGLADAEADARLAETDDAWGADAHPELPARGASLALPFEAVSGGGKRELHETPAAYSPRVRIEHRRAS